jgi:hypothetical protein
VFEETGEYGIFLFRQLPAGIIKHIRKKEQASQDSMKDLSNGLHLPVLRISITRYILCGRYQNLD